VFLFFILLFFIIIYTLFYNSLILRSVPSKLNVMRGLKDIIMDTVPWRDYLTCKEFMGM